MEVFNHVIKCPAMRSDQRLSDVTFLMNNNWNFTHSYQMASEDLEYTLLFSGAGSVRFLFVIVF